MRHKSIPYQCRSTFHIEFMRSLHICGLSCRFQQLSPLYGPGYLCITHPFATHHRSDAFDLHVLGTPPAFILSQDQTLHCLLYLSDNLLVCLALFYFLFISKLSLTLCFILSRSVFNVLSLISLVECPFILPSLLSFVKLFLYLFSFFLYLLLFLPLYRCFFICIFLP